MWTTNYIGLPYKTHGRDRSGLDCWGLVRLIYKEQYSIELPSWASEYLEKDYDTINELISINKEGWTQTTEVAEGNVLVFKMLGRECHVGVAINSHQFIHIRDGLDSVIETLDGPTWKRRFVGSYKYSETSLSKVTTLTAIPNVLKPQKLTIPVPSGTKLGDLVSWVHKEYGTDLVQQKVHLVVNGVPVFEKDYNKIVQDNDILEYRAVALGGGGGGGKDPFRLILTLVVAFYAPQLAMKMASTGTFGATLAGAATASGATVASFMSAGGFAASLLTAGVTMVGMALVDLIAPIRMPDAPNDPGAPKQLYISGGSQNQLQPYGRIPFVLGRVRLTPPHGALPANDFKTSEESWLKSLYIWGYAPLALEEDTIRIGQTSISSYGPENENYFIKHITYDTQEDSTGNKSTYWKQQGAAVDRVYGNDKSQVFANQQLLRQDEGGITPIPGESSTPTSEEIYSQVISNSTTYGGYSYTYSDSVRIVIAFPQGCRKIDKQGNSGASPVSFKIEYREIIDGIEGTWQPFPAEGVDSEGMYIVGQDAAIKDGFSVTIDSASIAGSRISTTNVILGDPPTATSEIEVRVGRYTSSVSRLDQGDEGYTGDTYAYQSSIVSITSVINQNPLREPEGVKVARTALDILATNRLNGQQEAVSAVVQTMCRICTSYDPNTNTAQWTTHPTTPSSNPAALFLHVLTHRAGQQFIDWLDSPEEKIDLNALGYWYTYCEAKGFEFNDIVVESRSVLEILRDIAAAGRASPSMVNGKWSVVIDEPRTLTTQMFTPSNSWGFEAIKAIPKYPDALRVTFFDEDNNWQQNEVIVYAAGKNAATAKVFESIQLPGVTNKDQVVDHTKWHMAQAMLRPEVYTLNVDAEYLVCTRGDLVKVQHDVPMWGTGSGKVVDVYTDSGKEGILVDDPIYLEENESFYLAVRLNTGTISSDSNTPGNISTSVGNDYFNSFYSNHVDQTVILGLNPARTSKLKLYTRDKVTISLPGFWEETLVITGVTDTEISGIVETGTASYTKSSEEMLAYDVGIKKLSGYYNYYPLESTHTDIANIEPDNLFAIGTIDTTFQELVVIKIEATSNTTARITLSDYGYNTNGDSIYDVYLSYTEEDFDYQTNITPVPVSRSNEIDILSPYIISAISDETVITYNSDGSLICNIVVLHSKYSDTADPNTRYPTNIVKVQASVRIQNSQVEDFYEELAIKPSIKIPNVEEGEVYEIKLRYVTQEGFVGPWGNVKAVEVLGKRRPPDFVQNFYGVVDPAAEAAAMSWLPNDELDIASYIIKKGTPSGTAGSVIWTPPALWGSSTDIAWKGTGLNANIPITDAEWELGEIKYYIKALDTSGNFSTFSSEYLLHLTEQPLSLDVDYRYGASGTSLTSSNLQVKWEMAPDQINQFRVKSYKLVIHNAVREGIASGDLRYEDLDPSEILVELDTFGNNADVPVTWAATNETSVYLLIVVYNTKNKEAGQYLFGDPLTLFGTRPVSSLNYDILDNVITLTWEPPEIPEGQEANSLPVFTYEIYESSQQTQIFDIASPNVVQIGSKAGLFTTITKTIPGYFKYWVVPVSSTGIRGEETETEYKKVFAPADYETLASGTFNLPNYESIDSVLVFNDHIIAPVNTTETWAEHFNHFDANTFGNGDGSISISDLISEGYTRYLSPAYNTQTSTYTTETIDLGSTINFGILSISFITEKLLGQFSVEIQIQKLSDVGGTVEETYPIGNSIPVSNIRYFRVNIFVSDLDLESEFKASLAKISRIKYLLEAKLLTSSGSNSLLDTLGTGTGFIASETGTPVGVNKEMVRFNSITLSPPDSGDATSVSYVPLKNGHLASVVPDELLNPSGTVGNSFITITSELESAPGVMLPFDSYNYTDIVGARVYLEFSGTWTGNFTRIPNPGYYTILAASDTAENPGTLCRFTVNLAEVQENSDIVSTVYGSIASGAVATLQYFRAFLRNQAGTPVSATEAGWIVRGFR